MAQSLLQRTPAAVRRTPLERWHLISLDAPTVAGLWTWFLGRACGATLPWASVAAMVLAVWILYAGDRILDARRAETAEELEERHRFHDRHIARFVAGIAIATIALGCMIPWLSTEALRLYLVEGAVLIVWLGAVHATPLGERLPKEIAVGLFFAAATFIPTVARRPVMRLALLPDAALFAGVCALNCLFIRVWEHGAIARNAMTRIAARNVSALSWALIASAICVAVLERRAPWQIAAACALAATALLQIHRIRHRLPRTTLRALADLALLTPLLLAPFLR